MAVVRELITLLGTQFDDTGLKQYENGIKRVKEFAVATGAAIGVAFSIEKIAEFVQGLVDTGQEINLIDRQLRAMARPFDDINEAQEGVLATAQLLGERYKDVLLTFKEFYNEMRETNIPAEQIVKTTENIYKALQIGHASAEDIHATMELFDRSFKRGGMRSMGIGQLSDSGPKVLDILKEFFKTNEDGLRKLAKDGKITSEVIVQAFGQANAKLDAEHAKLPMTLRRAFNIIHNDMSKFVADIFKATEAFDWMGRTVIFVWERIKYSIKTVSDAVGGLTNLIRFLGILIAVTVGPAIIRTLVLATAQTVKWAIANAGLLIQWLAIGAAIFAVAIAIEDVVGWMQGRRSLIGTWVGPFDELAENFKKLDIFAGLRIFDDLMKGDWSKALEDLKILLGSVEAQVLAIGLAATGAFAAWKIFKTAQMVMEIFKVKAAVEAVGEAADATSKKMGGTKAPPGKSIIPEVGGKPGGLETFLFSGQVATAATAVVAGALAYKQAFEDEEGFFGEWKRAFRNQRFDWKGNKGTAPPPATPAPLEPVTGPATGPIVVPPAIANKGTGKKTLSFADWDKKSLSTALGLGRLSEGLPMLPPGAFGRPVGPTTNNIQPNFTQNVGGIIINAAMDGEQIGRAVSEKVGKLSEFQFNAFARDLQTSAPRVESASQ